MATYTDAIAAAQTMVMERKIAKLEAICNSLAGRVITLERQLTNLQPLSSSGGCFSTIDVESEDGDGVELQAVQPALPGGVPVEAGGVPAEAGGVPEEASHGRGGREHGNTEETDTVDAVLNAAQVAFGGSKDDGKATSATEMDELREALNDSFAENACGSWCVDSMDNMWLNS